MDQSVFGILHQSDLIHILTSPEPIDLEKTRHLIKRLEADFAFEAAKIKVVINEYKLAHLNYEEELNLLKHSIFATLPKIEFAASDRLALDEPNSEYAKAVRRISRELGDCLVGLVLGVGVAYGLCHIGVLKVIEEEKIPIDIICGSSIGALIAALWATGLSSDQILEITEREFKQPKYIWSNLIDITFPFLGFSRVNKLEKFLRRYLNQKTFYDVKLPLKIIASDVKKKETRVFDKGPLVEALIASCSMPGVFTPFRLRGEMLFDGGVINPLPTEPLFKLGVKKIIAVNVTPSREDILRQYEKIKEQITVTLPQDIRKKRWLSLKQYFKEALKTNILDIVFSSIEILQSEVAGKEGQFADIVLHPDLAGLYWLELHRGKDFVKRGEEEARRNLDKIWQIVNE
jgi:NTE family protein